MGLVDDRQVESDIPPAQALVDDDVSDGRERDERPRAAEWYGG